MEKITKEALWAKIRIARTVPLEEAPEPTQTRQRVSLDEIRSFDRSRRIESARRAYIYARLDEGLSFAQVGALVGRSQKQIGEFALRRKRASEEGKSERNKAIMAAVIQGDSYRKIARDMGISVNVVAGLAYRKRLEADHG